MLAAARTVVAFGIILQVAGFGRLLVIADYFGAGPVLDAYYLGLVIPTFIAGVSAGILQTVFVPAYVTARTGGDERTARSLADGALTWALVVPAVCAALLVVARGLIVAWLVRHSPAETRVALELAFVLIVWTAPLNCLADCGALLLNAEGRFVAAAAAPLLNVAVGILMLIACRDLGIYALVWSLMAGLVAQAVMVLLAIRAVGITVRPRFYIPAALSHALGAVALPVLVGSVLGSVVPAFIQTVSSRAGLGAVSAMGYASRLNNSLVQAVVLSVSVVLLPHFARLTSQGKTDELRATLERVFAATLLFFASSVVLVAASGTRLVSLLLQRGNFSLTDAQHVAGVWLALTLGLLGATWGIFLARLFQAWRRPWVITALGIVSVALNTALAYALLPLWGVVGVALANSLAYTVIMSLLHLGASKSIGHVLTQTTGLFALRVVVVNLLAYALALWLAQLLGPMGSLVVLSAQAVAVLAPNVWLARGAPLHLTLRSALRA